MFKILVLGGNGFVGSLVAKNAAEGGALVVAVSRRGELTEDGSPIEDNKEVVASAEEGGNAGAKPVSETSRGVITHVKANAADLTALTKVFTDYGPFDAVVHCIGVLLDSDSGLGKLNYIASGSRSQPDDTSTYDSVTRQTAFNAIDLTAKMMKDMHAAQPTGGPRQCPFIFVSAAEAGWTIQSPVGFLERYLVAKRAVERKLMHTYITAYLRPVIMRPSIIWTTRRPVEAVTGALSSIGHYVGNFIGIPFLDKPVFLETLVRAILCSIDDYKVDGIKRFPEIEALGAAYRPGA